MRHKVQRHGGLPVIMKLWQIRVGRQRAEKGVAMKEEGGKGGYAFKRPE